MAECGGIKGVMKTECSSGVFIVQCIY